MVIPSQSELDKDLDQYMANRKKNKTDLVRNEFCLLQWGSESQPFEVQRHLKSGLFEGQISNGHVSAMEIAIVPTIQNPEVFVRISNGF